MTQVTVANANEILKQYLKSHGITQKFVADKMGLIDKPLTLTLMG